MTMKAQNDDDWGFSETQFDEDAYNSSIHGFNTPITQHDCEKRGCLGRLALVNHHDFESVWDDFKLSQRQRELLFMEVIRSQGRQNREGTLLRQFVSTSDGSFIIRVMTSTMLTPERVGEIKFTTREECAEYFNYCLELFGFTETEPVPETDYTGESFFADLDAENEGQDFFDDLDEFEGGFFDDLDGTDEDEIEWDTD